MYCTYVPPQPADFSHIKIILSLRAHCHKPLKFIFPVPVHIKINNNNKNVFSIYVHFCVCTDIYEAMYGVYTDGRTND